MATTKFTVSKTEFTSLDAQGVFNEDALLSELESATATGIVLDTDELNVHVTYATAQSSATETTINNTCAAHTGVAFQRKPNGFLPPTGNRFTDSGSMTNVPGTLLQSGLMAPGNYLLSWACAHSLEDSPVDSSHFSNVAPFYRIGAGSWVKCDLGDDHNGEDTPRSVSPRLIITTETGSTISLKWQFCAGVPSNRSMVKSAQVSYRRFR